MQKENESEAERNERMTEIVDALLKIGQTYDESQRLYKEWAKDGSYDKMLDSHIEHYAGPFMVTNKCIQLVTDPNKALVLDLGCGTGIVAQMIKEKGSFQNIHGLDPCEEFVELSRSKGLYQKFLVQCVGRGKVIDAENDTYDAVVSNGAFCPGHIPCDALHEVVRVLKPGGFFINCIREEFLDLEPEYKDRLQPLTEQLVKDGKWKKICWERFDNHFKTKTGIVMVFQVC